MTSDSHMGKFSSLSLFLLSFRSGTGSFPETHKNRDAPERQQLKINSVCVYVWGLFPLSPPTISFVFFFFFLSILCFYIMCR